MLLTHTSGRPRLRPLTLALALVALLTFPALTTTVSAQSEVDNETGITVTAAGADISVNEEGVSVTAGEVNIGILDEGVTISAIGGRTYELRGKILRITPLDDPG